MSQLRKLLFTKKFSDYEGYKWVLSTYKAIAWCITILVIAIILYGMFIVEDSKEFFGNVLFYVIVISIALIVILFLSGTVSKFTKFARKFLLLVILLTFIYSILGIVFDNFLDIQFYVGYSTWILLTVLAGWGAKKEEIFNGNIDRHDVFYSLVVFIMMVGANWKITSNGGVLQNFDILIERILSMIPAISEIFSNL